MINNVKIVERFSFNKKHKRVEGIPNGSSLLQPNQTSSLAWPKDGDLALSTAFNWEVSSNSNGFVLLRAYPKED